MATDTIPIPVARALKWLNNDKSEYGDARDSEIRCMQAAYDGHLFDLDKYAYRNSSLTDIDPAERAGAGAGPRLTELNAPFVRGAVEDWKAICGIVPSFTIPPEDPSDPASQSRADFIEKIVYAIASDSDLESQVIMGAHYSTLFGAKIMTVFPFLDEKRVRLEIRSPYRAYARPIDRRGNLMYVAFDYDEYTEVVLEQYPEVEAMFRGKAERSRPETVTVTEWWDQDYRMLLINRAWVPGMPMVRHNLGFVPARVVQNIVGPGFWGRSDVYQILHITQLYSELISMVQDAMYRSVYDPPIIFDDNEIKTLDVRMGEAIQLSANARVGTLRSNVQVPEANAMLALLEHLARIGSGWPEVLSSTMDSDVISGKAFVAAQEPVAARAALRHIIDARNMEACMGMALRMYERLWPNDEISIFMVPGGVRTNIIPTAGKAEATRVTFVPSRDIAGKYDVVCTYPTSGADTYRETIRQLQLKNAGLLSDETFWQINRGFDSEAEIARLERQAIRDAQRQAAAQSIMADAQMQAQIRMAMQLAQIQQGVQAQQAGAAPEGMMGQPEAAAGAVPQMVGAGEAETETTAAPPIPAQPTPAAAARRATLAEVRNAIAAVTGLRGRVFVGGQIVSTGMTEGPIEIWLTDMQDKGPIFQQTLLGRQKRFLVHALDPDNPPTIQLVEITPGQGGA